MWIFILKIDYRRRNLQTTHWIRVIGSVCATLAKLKPDIFVKGGDYKKEELTEYKLVSGYGGEIVIAPYIEGCSTTAIIESILNS